MKMWQRILLAKILLCIMWPVTVYAAVGVVTPDDPFAAITLQQLLVMLVVATLSGATALVHRLDNEYKSQKLRKRSISLLVSSHMLGSLSAGVLAFAISQMMYIQIWGQLVGVICASFLGAKFVENFANSYIKSLTKETSTND